MSARRFRHRDRQQVRPGLPQQAPGGAPPGIRIRSIRHYALPHRHQAVRKWDTRRAFDTPDSRSHTLRASAIRHTTGIGCPTSGARRTPASGTPGSRLHTLRKSAIRHTTGIGCPNIGRSPDTGVRHTGLPAAYASEIKYPVFPTSGAAGRLASGMKNRA